jgi:metallo-beta-lactamase class B
VEVRLKIVAFVLALTAGSGFTFAQGRGGAPPAPRALASQAPADMPFQPHQIAGNLYYVGTSGLGVYLITTPQGHILINGVYPASVPLVRASVETLGFKMTDIKLMLNSHAHPDHVSGNADLKALTGASVLVMDDDVDVIKTGGKSDFQYAAQENYPPGPVDRVLHDGEHVKLGDMDLTAVKTPGHTRGCTTWTFSVIDAGRPQNVVILCSINFNPGYKLVDNAQWPQIAAGFTHTYKTVAALPVDIWLAPHTFMFGLPQKFEKKRAGGDVNPYVAPDEYKTYVAGRRNDFLQELAKQMTP